MRKEPDCSDSFPILSRENYNPETIHSTTCLLYTSILQDSHFLQAELFGDILFAVV